MLYVLKSVRVHLGRIMRRFDRYAVNTTRSA